MTPRARTNLEYDGSAEKVSAQNLTRELDAYDKAAQGVQAMKNLAEVIGRQLEW